MYNRQYHQHGQRPSGRLRKLRTARIGVIGAGIGGLAAALDLARTGFEVLLFEKATAPGGKLREVAVGGRRLDAGPTVFTLRGVFDDLFADAGDHLDRHLHLVPARLLARHAWDSGGQLDLFADVGRSTEAIGDFAGSRAARGFERFIAQTKRIYTTLDNAFIQAARPSPIDLVLRIGIGNLNDLWNVQPFSNLWQSLGGYFEDVRLQQLFGRYATYCGSSPFLAPATLMLIAHVEQSGVWYVDGGMHRLAAALAALVERHGARLSYGREVTQIHTSKGRVSGLEIDGRERVEVDAVVCNADSNALACGRFGRAAADSVGATPAAARSLSAVTWNLLARTGGFALAHHSVFFNADYRAEFDDIFRRRRLPQSPTIYVCAQDRRDAAGVQPGQFERLLCLVNAPPIGDTHPFDTAEIESCETRVFAMLEKSGLIVDRPAGGTIATNPSDFNRLFPATGGALYGPASHGWKASFKRTGSRSALPGLYLAGGSSHPGPGLPMAATSGRLAAACIIADHASIARSRTAAMSGGTSMRSATMGRTR
jgi:1-hydroxycarotenoid 3,4-desaturase